MLDQDNALDGMFRPELRNFVGTRIGFPDGDLIISVTSSGGTDCGSGYNAFGWSVISKCRASSQLKFSAECHAVPHKHVRQVSTSA